MVFRRFKYPVPKFPPNVASTFKRLCVAAPVEKIPEIQADLDECLAQMREEAKNKPNLDLRLIDAIGEKCHLLLTMYADASKKEQGFIMGAVRYFVYDDDPFPDGAFATGLDDDAGIINHVLERLGLEEEHHIDVH